MTTNPPEIAPKSAADFLAKASSLLDGEASSTIPEPGTQRTEGCRSV